MQQRVRFQVPVTGLLPAASPGPMIRLFEKIVFGRLLRPLPFFIFFSLRCALGFSPDTTDGGAGERRGWGWPARSWEWRVRMG